MSETDLEPENGFDSDRQYIAGVYAKSLIDAAEKVSKSDEVLQELDSFVNDVLKGVPTLELALTSPRLSADEKNRLIDAAIGRQANPLLVNFLKVVNAHGRLDCLAAINARAKEMLNELRGRVDAEVIVAEEISEDQQSQIADRLRGLLGKEVILDVRTDPSILGGMIVKVGDTVYDASLANRLEQVRQTALDRTMQKVRGSLGAFVVDSEGSPE